MVNFSFKPLRQTVVEVGEWFRGPDALFGSLSPRNRPTDIWCGVSPIKISMYVLKKYGMPEVY